MTTKELHVFDMYMIGFYDARIWNAHTTPYSTRYNTVEAQQIHIMHVCIYG
jgi:hypothetical protein